MAICSVVSSTVIAAQPELMVSTSRTKFRFVDNNNLQSKISQVANDVQHIIDSHECTSYPLNTHKYKIITNNFELVNKFSIQILNELQRRT